MIGGTGHRIDLWIRVVAVPEAVGVPVSVRVELVAVDLAITIVIDDTVADGDSERVDVDRSVIAIPRANGPAISVRVYVSVLYLAIAVRIHTVAGLLRAWMDIRAPVHAVALALCVAVPVHVGLLVTEEAITIRIQAVAPLWRPRVYAGMAIVTVALADGPPVQVAIAGRRNTLGVAPRTRSPDREPYHEPSRPPPGSLYDAH